MHKGILLTALMLTAGTVFAKSRDAIPEDYEAVQIVENCHADQKAAITKLKSAISRGALWRDFKYLQQVGGRTRKVHFNAFSKSFWPDCPHLRDFLCEDLGKDKCLAAYGNYCNLSNTPKMKDLIRKGASAKALDQNGFSIIGNCLRYKNTDMISFLLQNGADINDGEGEALATVASIDDEKLVDFILSYKPKIYLWHEEKIWQPGENVKKTKNEKLIKKLEDYFKETAK